MAKFISLEENIYIFKVETETDLQPFTIESVKQRLGVEDSRIIFSLRKLTDVKPFLVISYKTIYGEIKHWETSITLENFTENYNYLLVKMDEETDQCKCCGPINISLLAPEVNAFVFAIREAPKLMDRATAEQLLAEGKVKKVVRKNREGATVISFKNENQFLHFSLREYQAENIRRCQACIVYGDEYDLLELQTAKWQNLATMPIKTEVLSLFLLSRNKIKSLWRKGEMSYEQINTTLPIQTLVLQDFKSEMLVEAAMAVHFNFFKQWLESHRQYQTYYVGIPYQTFISDMLSGAFNLEKHGRATSGFPHHLFRGELLYSFHKFEIFQFDSYDINKVRVAVSLNIYPPQNSKLRFLKINSCSVNLNVMKHLLLCCYTANYLENLLKTITTDADIAILQENLQLLDSEIIFNKSIHENLIKTECTYINIYNLNPQHTKELTILLWMGNNKAYFVPFSKIIEFVKSKEVLNKETLELLVPAEFIHLLKPSEEEPSASTLEM